MKANELRIGNWIRYSQHYVRVKDILGHNWVKTYEIIDGDLDHYDGIPLTPEILEKCGFVRHYDDRLWYKLSDNEVRFTLWSYLIPDSYCFKFMTFRSSEIYHLHQLQNLYHSLTQTELNVEIL